MDQDYDEKTMPNQFLCPISQEIMKDPVLTIDGFCFDRRQIQEWFNKGKNTNPLTGMALTSTNLIENRALRNVIEHHNIRLREIQRQADLNAQKIIKKHNQRFTEIYPQLINDFGLLDLDKFAALANQTSYLKGVIKSAKDKFVELRKCCDDSSKNCKSCQAFVSNLTRFKSFIDNEMEENLKMGSVLEQKRIGPESIPYLIINTEIIRGIDFRRTKKEDLKISEFKGILVTVLSVEELIARIRRLHKIPQKDFVRVWVTNYTTVQLHEHISNQVETITGTYLCKVKCVGKKVENMKKKVKELEMDSTSYLIIEHGPGEEYVFRDDVAKCDYCYKIKKIETHCDCKKVFYCSNECKTKDKCYHENICRLNQNKSSKV